MPAPACNPLCVALGQTSYYRGADDLLKITREQEIPFAVEQILNISFQCTVRVADDGSTSQLPPSLGTFPLFKVEDYYGRLPTTMTAKGGFFMPIYQREAMWINFKAETPFAIKIYVGGVNAVSGEPARETIETQRRRAERLKQSASIQDYLFVATKLGSGYSVEAQLTGEEVVGGLQIEVTPSKEVIEPSRYDAYVPDGQERLELHVQTVTGLRYTLSVCKQHKIFHLKSFMQDLTGMRPGEQRMICRGQCLADEKTLADYGIESTITIHLFAVLRGGGCIPPKPHELMGVAPGGLIKQTIIADTHDPEIWDPASTVIFNVQMLNSEVFRRCTGLEPPPTAVTAQEYAKQGFPYYELYNEKPSQNFGKFNGMKSVNEMDVESAADDAEKAAAATEVSKSTDNRVVLLNADGQRVGFRTVKDMEKEVRERFRDLGL